MKSYQGKLKLLAILLMLVGPKITYGQGGLLGSWKYVSPGGEMTMQISANTIVINGESFPYKAQGNLLMINMRQNNGMITELMYSGTLYATGLCE